MSDSSDTSPERRGEEWFFLGIVIALAMVAAFVGLAAVVSLLAIMFGPFAMK